MLEWSEKNKFNSFSSWKGLLYADWYKAIIEWRDGIRYQPLPPIEASIDPAPNGACNLSCKHCNAKSYLNNAKGYVTDESLMDLHKFLIDWGVKAICLGGGGEPTLRKNLPQILGYISERDRQSSIATNGINFSEELIYISSHVCRWIAVSVDSATPETYLAYRGADMFRKTIDTISKLANMARKDNTMCDVAYKFLITPLNQHEIYDACKLAKELGAKDFHARPCDLSHQGMGDDTLEELKYDIPKIIEQFEKCRELEDANFNVYTIIHKFDKNFKPIKNFKQCYAMPLIIQCCPDGNVYSCVDQRLQDNFKLGTFFPDPKEILKFWGGKKHYDLTFGNTPKICDTRCTFTCYCEQCEKMFVEEEKDYMCKWFT